MREIAAIPLHREILDVDEEETALRGIKRNVAGKRHEALLMPG
jgi:hypothetical protein